MARVGMRDGNDEVDKGSALLQDGDLIRGYAHPAGRPSPPAMMGDISSLQAVHPSDSAVIAAHCGRRFLQVIRKACSE